VALAGAPVNGDAPRPHIAMLAIEGAGARVAYHRMWLGGAESDRFAAGGKPAVLEVDGWRLGLAICKDTGVDQHASDTAALGIDAYFAGILESAEDAAVLDERARRVATGHQAWVVMASFAGSTGGAFLQRGRPFGRLKVRWRRGRPGWARARRPRAGHAQLILRGPCALVRLGDGRPCARVACAACAAG
jgi:predicted amidohydrolase